VWAALLDGQSPPPAARATEAAAAPSSSIRCRRCPPASAKRQAPGDQTPAARPGGWRPSARLSGAGLIWSTSGIGSKCLSRDATGQPRVLTSPRSTRRCRARSPRRCGTPPEAQRGGPRSPCPVGMRRCAPITRSARPRRASPPAGVDVPVTEFGERDDADRENRRVGSRSRGSRPARDRSPGRSADWTTFTNTCRTGWSRAAPPDGTSPAV
jgi:hypothetical protein